MDEPFKARTQLLPTHTQLDAPSSHRDKEGVNLTVPESLQMHGASQQAR